MTTAVQVQFRRGSSTQVASFTGAAGEMVVDTTNNRVVVQDGSTAGGFPAAKLSEVQTNTRTQVSDGNYTALTTDRTIAYITLTASRTVSLPAAASYPTGCRLLAVDESGACSGSKTITLSANGSDLIDGAATAIINSAYGYLALEGNGANKWTIVDQVGAAGGVTSVNTLSGALSIAATDGMSVSASGTTVSIGGPGGMVNRFRNGTMDVWQRGNSALTATTSGAYTADGWIVLPTGASVTAAQAAGRLVTKNSLQVTGAASVTDLLIKQRIESLIAAAFCSQTVTVQAQVYNGTGGSITPKLTVNRATGVDNGAYTNVDVSAVSLQACANGAWTQVAYTFAANANSYNGLEIVFDFGNNLGANTKTVQITECDIRVTPGAATGLNSNPPPPELRHVQAELALCQRYFWQNASGIAYGSYSFGAASSSTSASFFIQYPQVMRAVPTFFQSNTAVTVNFGAANAATGFGTNQAGQMSASIVVNVASGLTANELANWVNDNNAAGYIGAGAEL